MAAKRRDTRYARSLAVRIWICAVLVGGTALAGAGVASAKGPADSGTTSASSQESSSSSAPSGTGSATARDAADSAPNSLRKPKTRPSGPLSVRESRSRADLRAAATEIRRPGLRTASARADADPAPETGAAVQRAEAAVTAEAAPPTPSPADAAPTPYGEIGKWMLKAGGQIANWGGKRVGGKTLLEAVNVIIVDPHSTTPGQAARNVNNAMLRSGFPAQYLHSFGFRGRIDGATYGQKPTGPLLAYSNNFFLFPNDHGRLFGPAPMQTEAGYVWTGAFSTEKVGFSGLLPGHVYVSSNQARDALVQQLISSGQATYGGLVPLENAYNTASTTTGDHDGFAVVLVLTGNAPLVRREAVLGELPRSAAETGDQRCLAGAGAAVQRPHEPGPLTLCGAGRPASIDS
ncbi:hypothetical protein [Mycolicibacterium diernhoferi]|nr:hypothetical protein [Mycolicibacterium diernhoferi]QYL21565.1 hypothetical protein K0O62_21560 [Mycolicibacterium diernhoferi]